MSAVMPARRLVHGVAGQRKASKFGNKRTACEGFNFASKREAGRYAQLLLLEKNGEVRDIKLQVVYRLEFNGVLICRYHADFVYEERKHETWAEVVEDVKGFKTPAYKLKKKLMRACHGVEIRET